MDDLPANWLTGCGPWRQFAACRSADPELFFPVPAPGPGPGLRQGEEAKAICAGCPVRGQCLAFATRDQAGTRSLGRPDGGRAPHTGERSVTSRAGTTAHQPAEGGRVELNTRRPTGDKFASPW